MTKNQRRRKASQRAWHNGIDRSPTDLPLINVWLDEVNAFFPEPYSFGAVSGPGYDLGTPSWVEDREQAWGLDYRQRVLGEWPTDEKVISSPAESCPFCGVAFGHNQAACDEKMANWRPTGFLGL